MNKHPIVHSAEFLRKRRLLTVAPLLGLPFLFFMFYSLGGGRDGAQPAAANAGMGFNANLPEAKVKAAQQEPDKQAYYRKADADSMKKRAFWQLDPYHRQGLDTEARKMGEARPLYADDPKAAALMKQLDRLQETVRQPPKVAPAVPVVRPVVERSERPALMRASRKEAEAAPVEVDPELQKLDGMLDKIMRIQHPEEVKKVEGTAGLEESDTASANSLLAVVEVGQELVAGATVGLRLEAGAKVGNVVLPKGLVVYGVVSIQGDRLLVNVNTVRRERSIFSVALQVYDMDGLPGIHIPGSLGRETAKQSADQAIGTMNPLVYEPGIEVQAANAGIATAKLC